MNFKEYIYSMELPEEMKEDIVKRHVEEEREITDRANNILSQERGEKDLIKNAASELRERNARLEKNNRECVDECRGALAAVAAMLRYQHGTHLMKAHQNEAVAVWIDQARKGLSKYNFDSNEFPF